MRRPKLALGCDSHAVLRALPVGVVTWPPRSPPGVLEIDTLLGGWERVTAGYLVDGAEPVLVETGSQSSVPALLAALADLGVGADDLAGVAVTHIHLDHAGGVGDVARAFPNATVYVHEKGARHLVDPTKLVDSRGDGLRRPARHALRPARPDARPSASTCSPTARTSSSAPDRVLTTVDSPGPRQAPPRRCTTRESGMLFAGDAVGVRLPDAGVLRPSTPPPDFDLDQALDVAAPSSPTAARPGIALAHYGLVPDPMAIARRGRRRSSPAGPRWPRRRGSEGDDIAAALDAAFGGDLDGVDPVAPGEARDAQRHPLQRRRVPPLARQAGRPRPPPRSPRISRPTAAHRGDRPT